MSFSYYKFLWLLAHLLVNVIEAIYQFGLEFREKLINYVKNITKQGRKRDDRHLLETEISELKKLPKHLGVILQADHEEDVDVKQLSNLVSWSLSTGVNYVSFYDYKGVLKHQLSSIFRKTLENHINKSESENVVWGPDFQNTSGDIRFPHRNGYKRHVVVNLFSSDDCQPKFTQLLTQEFFDAGISSKEISIEQVDDKVSKLYGRIPDPDLAVYFGSVCCTTGFMPWQIRLTEFIKLSHKLQNVTVEKYIKVLYKFAKCQQRFGK